MLISIFKLCTVDKSSRWYRVRSERTGHYRRDLSHWNHIYWTHCSLASRVIRNRNKWKNIDVLTRISILPSLSSSVALEKFTVAVSELIFICYRKLRHWLCGLYFKEWKRNTERLLNFSKVKTKKDILVTSSFQI